MTLVVAQATEDGPRVVSDTRVGFDDGRRPSFKTGTLKAIIVSRRVIICFAGDVAIGLDGVRRAATRLTSGESVEDVLPGLRERTSDTRRRVEFVVATAEAGSVLIRIRGGEIEMSPHSVWIGDQHAFDRFQERRHKPIDNVRLKMMDQLPPGAKAMLTLGDAMQAVIDDPTIPSVDDFCVRASAKEGEFNYLGQTFIHVGRDITVKPGENLIAKMAQSVEEGGYAVSVVEPAQPGTPALALNFPRARLGMIYLPLEYDHAQIVQDVSPKDFARVVLDRFGVALTDPLLRNA